MGDYPDSVDLDALRTFTGTLADFAQAVVDVWQEDFGTATLTRVEAPTEGHGLELRLVTGGWSGNEDIVSAVEDTMFHVLAWQMSQRGGLHVYRVPRNLADVAFDMALPRAQSAG